ncbi:hypothetical protein ACOME3_006129 [Neoechinorhynchus agilis]
MQRNNSNDSEDVRDNSDESRKSDNLTSLLQDILDVQNSPNIEVTVDHDVSSAMESKSTNDCLRTKEHKSPSPSTITPVAEFNAIKNNQSTGDFSTNLTILLQEIMSYNNGTPYESLADSYKTPHSAATDQILPSMGLSHHLNVSSVEDFGAVQTGETPSSRNEGSRTGLTSLLQDILGANNNLQYDSIISAEDTNFKEATNYCITVNTNPPIRSKDSSVKEFIAGETGENKSNGNEESQIGLNSLLQDILGVNNGPQNDSIISAQRPNCMESSSDSIAVNMNSPIRSKDSSVKEFSAGETGENKSNGNEESQTSLTFLLQDILVVNNGPQYDSIISAQRPNSTESSSDSVTVNANPSIRSRDSSIEDFGAVGTGENLSSGNEEGQIGLTSLLQDILDANNNLQDDSVISVQRPIFTESSSIHSLANEQIYLNTESSNRRSVSSVANFRIGGSGTNQSSSIDNENRTDFTSMRREILYINGGPDYRFLNGSLDSNSMESTHNQLSISSVVILRIGGTGANQSSIDGENRTDLISTSQEILYINGGPDYRFLNGSIDSNSMESTHNQLSISSVVILRIGETGTNQSSSIDGESRLNQSRIQSVANLNMSGTCADQLNGNDENCAGFAPMLPDNLNVNNEPFNEHSVEMQQNNLDSEMIDQPETLNVSRRETEETSESIEEVIDSNVVADEADKPRESGD